MHYFPLNAVERATIWLLYLPNGFLFLSLFAYIDISTNMPPNRGRRMLLVVVEI